jgi:hypothetical protein
MFAKSLSWPVAIERVLSESDEPLTAIEIARRAAREGFVASISDHPSHSVKGAIARHIKEGNRRGFLIIRREAGQVFLYWLISKKLR